MSCETREPEKQQFQIKQAQEGDLPALCSIDNDQESHQAALEIQARGEGIFFVARQDKEIAGYVVLEFNYQSPHCPEEIHGFYLENLRVGDKFRQRGLGTMLVKQCEDEARQKGGKEVFLAVACANQETRAFYERQGYAQVPGVRFQSPAKKGEPLQFGIYYRKELAKKPDL